MTTAYAQVRGSRTGGVVQSQSYSSSAATKSVGSNALFGIFFMAVVVWLLFSAALLYHFKKFGGNDSKVRFASGLYIAGSLLLLFIALVSIS